MPRNTGLRLLAVLISLFIAPYMVEPVAGAVLLLPGSVLSMLSFLSDKVLVYSCVALIWLLFAILLAQIFVAIWGTRKGPV